MKEKFMSDLVMSYILYGYILNVLYWRQGCNNKVLLGLAVTNIERTNGRKLCKEILEIRNEAKIQLRKITRSSGGFSESWKSF